MSHVHLILKEGKQKINFKIRAATGPGVDYSPLGGL